MFKNHLLKPGHCATPKRSQMLIYSILSCARARMNRNSLKWHLIEGPVTFGFTLHLRVYDHTTWFWRCLETTFEDFFWALIISWSRLFARVWSYLKVCGCTSIRWLFSISWDRRVGHMTQKWATPATSTILGRLDNWLGNNNVQLRGCLHHVPRSCPMSKGLFS